MDMEFMSNLSSKTGEPRAETGPTGLVLAGAVLTLADDDLELAGCECGHQALARRGEAATCAGEEEQGGLDLLAIGAMDGRGELDGLADLERHFSRLDAQRSCRFLLGGLGVLESCRRRREGGGGQQETREENGARGAQAWGGSQHVEWGSGEHSIIGAPDHLPRTALGNQVRSA